MSDFRGGAVDLGSFVPADESASAAQAGAARAADVGAVNTPSSADAGGASTAATVSGSLVVELTQERVQELAHNSTRLPVLVVFHSVRSAASQTLVEDLAELARASGGRFQLARADVDAHPEFLQVFGIRGVPAVVAMLHGQLAPLFEGVPAAGELASIVEQVLAAAAQNGLTGTIAGDGEEGAAAMPAPPHHREAQEALDAGDLATAKAEFEAALRENPGDSFASTGIAQVEMLERLDGTDVAAALGAGERAELTDVPAQLAYSDALMAVGNVDGCFAQLIEVVKMTSGEERETVRARLVELFAIVGGDDPRVMEARRSLASALF